MNERNKTQQKILQKIMISIEAHSSIINSSLFKNGNIKSNLSKTIITILSNPKMKQYSTQAQSHKDKCTICMIRYQNSRLNQCNHRFCFSCINKWSKKSNSCPHCRGKFTSIITKQKFRKNSKIIKEGRLINRPNPTISHLDLITRIRSIELKIIYRPTICFLPIACFPFSFYSLQYPTLNLAITSA